MKKNLQWMLVTAALILGIGMTCIGRASSTPPSVSLDPVQVKDLNPGESFTVDVTVAGVVISEIIGYKCYGLYGWDINLTFNPAVLNVINVTEGPFLKGVAETIFLPERKNNDAGYVYAGALFKPPIPERGASGDGVLATIAFSVIGRGITDLHFDSSKINTSIEGNNVAIEHTDSDGKFINAAPSILSTELIIAIVVIAAIGGGVTVFFFKRRRR